MKRVRTIYMSDEVWRKLQEGAYEARMNMDEYLSVLLLSQELNSDNEHIKHKTLFHREHIKHKTLFHRIRLSSDVSDMAKVLDEELCCDLCEFQDGRYCTGIGGNKCVEGISIRLNSGIGTNVKKRDVKTIPNDEVNRVDSK